MRSGGWKPFWAALFASLLVLVPLVGGTVLLSRQQLRTQLRQAARSESGVPIQLPKTTDQLTVLLCVSSEQPGFVLAYLNASQNCVHLLSVPAALTVPFAEEETSLARCYAAAGPARCRRCWPCRRAPGIWLFRLRCWNESPTGTGRCGWALPAH